MRANLLKSVILASTLFTGARADAWGFEGHEVVAAIARAELSPAIRAKVDAILATDTDNLTKPDMVSRATWADAWRSAGHEETASWHFVDTEVAAPDLDTACFGHPVPADPPSAGPAQDCVVDKIDEFRAELKAKTTTPAERLLALKYLLHFVGDVHQPLHAADNQDRGGNCVLLTAGGAQTMNLPADGDTAMVTVPGSDPQQVAAGQAMNLHAYWDTAVVTVLGSDPQQVAATLRAKITKQQRKVWRQGAASDWARESYGIAKATAYTIGSPPGCAPNPAPIALPAGYAAAADAAAATQLQKAGIRLAWVLTDALK